MTGPNVEEFDKALISVINDDLRRALNPAEFLMMIPGMYEVLSEYYNNAAIDFFREQHNNVNLDENE